MRYKKALITFVSICLIFTFLQICKAENNSDGKTYIYVIPVEGVIDNGVAVFTERAINEAEKTQAKALIFEIDTPVG